MCVKAPTVERGKSNGCEKDMLCAGLFSSNLSFCIYESNLFLWHNRAYHLIVCGAGFNQQTLNENTSELEAKRAQLQNCCVFNLSVCKSKKIMKRRGGWREKS